MYLALNSFIKFPPHARDFNQVLIPIASFQFFDTSKYIDPHFIDYPDDSEAYHRGFETFEIESSILFENLSVFIWTYGFYTVLAFTCLIALIFSQCHEKIQKFKTKIWRFITWGCYIRLFMESFLDIVLFTTLSLV